MLSERCTSMQEGQVECVVVVGQLGEGLMTGRRREGW